MVINCNSKCRLEKRRHTITEDNADTKCLLFWLFCIYKKYWNKQDKKEEEAEDMRKEMKQGNEDNSIRRDRLSHSYFPDKSELSHF